MLLKKLLRAGCELLILSISCITVSMASSNIEGIQIYQRNVHLSPIHKQKLDEDINRYRNADNLWDVLREEFALSHYEENGAVQDKIEWFMNNQDYLLRSATRAAPYLYYILQQVKKRHLPAELVLLPIIESGYNPFSMSHVGASGLWQLMPDTASGFGVKQDGWYDGRRDVVASTRAALTYLAYLQSFFDGNWLLAIAAYNTGEGNVSSAIKRNVRDGRETDFWSLPVAQQTKDYVPSLLALATIISHPDEYPIYFPPVRNAPYLAQVDIGSQINLKFAATLAGISYQKLMQLNPGFTRTVTATKGPYKVILPIENVAQFTENLARSSSNQQNNWIHYKVKTGDTLASIGKKFTLTATQLRKMNHLNKNEVGAGTDLLIMNKGALAYANDDNEVSLDAVSIRSRVAAAVNKIKRMESVITHYTLQPGDTIYMVRNQDNLEMVAKKFHVTSKAIRMANALTTNLLTVGKQLIIPTHNASMASMNAEMQDGIGAGDTIYMIRKGDTIEKIARQFHVSPSTIRLANLTDNHSLSEGERIIIPAHYNN